VITLPCRKLLHNHLKRLEKTGKLIKVKASYKLGDELKKAPKKAKPAKSKPAAKPATAAKPAAAKPKATKPKKAAPEKKAAGKHDRYAWVMLCLHRRVPQPLLRLCCCVLLPKSLCNMLNVLLRLLHIACAPVHV